MRRDGCESDAGEYGISAQDGDNQHNKQDREDREENEPQNLKFLPLLLQIVREFWLLSHGFSTCAGLKWAEQHQGGRSSFKPSDIRIPHTIINYTDQIPRTLRKSNDLRFRASVNRLQEKAALGFSSPEGIQGRLNSICLTQLLLLW